MAQAAPVSSAQPTPADAPARITAGALAGAIVTVIVYVLQTISTHAGYTVDVPKEVDAAFITIVTFILSWWLD